MSGDSQQLVPASVVAAFEQQVRAIPPGELTPTPPSTSPAVVALTRREIEILQWVAQGLTNVQVAQKLSITSRTVNVHLTSIYAKLGVNSRTAATRYAFQQKLL